MMTCRFCNEERGRFYSYIDTKHGFPNDISICAFCLYRHLSEYYPDSPAHLGVGDNLSEAERAKALALPLPETRGDPEVLFRSGWLVTAQAFRNEAQARRWYASRYGREADQCHKDRELWWLGWLTKSEMREESQEAQQLELAL